MDTHTVLTHGEVEGVVQACIKAVGLLGCRSKDCHFLSVNGEGHELVSRCIRSRSYDGCIGCAAYKRGDACFAIRSGNGCTAITVGRCQDSTLGVDLQIFDDFFCTVELTVPLGDVYRHLGKAVPEIEAYTAVCALGADKIGGHPVGILYAAGLIGGKGKVVILCVIRIHAIESILVGAIPYDVIVRIHGRPGHAIITIDRIGLALTLVCAGLVDHTDLRTCAKGGIAVCSVGEVIKARIGSI